MLNIKVNDNVKDAATDVCRILAYGAAIAAAYVLKTKAERMLVVEEPADYGRAVSAIMNSGMMSSYISEAVKLVARDETPEYYKAVITIAKSGMMSSYKLEAIGNLTTKKD